MVAKIKFCGMMQPEDATIAVGAGAAYLGVVFAGGPRAVSIVEAREVDELLRIGEKAELRGAQPHGPYSRTDASGLTASRRFGARPSGLTPETVGQALAEVRPDIVDVSSGVERRPGIKDPNTIARFVEAVFAHSSVS